MEQIWPSEFVCSLCVAMHNIKRRDNKYTAKREFSFCSEQASDIFCFVLS